MPSLKPYYMAVLYIIFFSAHQLCAPRPWANKLDFDYEGREGSTVCAYLVARDILI